MGTRQRAPHTVSLEDASVFNLSEYAECYTGRRKIQRLLFIGRSCPSLSVEAFRLAAESAKSDTIDVQLYQTACSEYKAAKSSAPAAGALHVDEDWITDTRRAAQRQGDKLEVELKSYQSNLIKESIAPGQMAFRDLGTFYHRSGDLSAAIRCHTKSRDYCTTPAHILDMCLAVIDLAIEMGNYSFVRNYVVKAESALESAGDRGLSAAGGGSSSGTAGKQTRAVNLPGMVAPQATREEEAREKEKQVLQDKLALAAGLADLGSGHYQRAARSFLSLNSNSIKTAAEAHDLYVSPGDVALYAVLCGLATFNRSEIKTRLIDNSGLRSLLETEAHLKRVLAAFYESKYATTLDLLNKHSPRHCLDLHLSPHVSVLVNSIRDRSVAAFCQPFASVSIAKMASSFGWSEASTKEHVLRLIQNGTLAARIDSKNGVIKAHQPDVRKELFLNAMQTGQAVEEATRKVQLRIQLLQNDLIVKDPAKQGQQQHQLQNTRQTRTTSMHQQEQQMDSDVEVMVS